MHACARTWTHAHVRTCTHVHVCTCTHKHTRAYANTHTIHTHQDLQLCGRLALYIQMKENTHHHLRPQPAASEPRQSPCAAGSYQTTRQVIRGRGQEHVCVRVCVRVCVCVCQRERERERETELRKDYSGLSSPKDTFL